jgi:glycine cleavage system H protein
MRLPEDCRYSKQHEWIRAHGDGGTVGITDHAQKELGDVVFVELPEIGQVFAADEVLANVESVKAVSEVYAPLAGEVVAVNSALGSSPQLVNEDPYGEAWFVRIKWVDSSDLDNLLTADEYRKYVEEESTG